MSDTLVITGKVRFSYVQVFTPKAMETGQELKYSVSLIIPKYDTVNLARIEKAIDAAFKLGITSKFEGKTPKNWKNPLRDGDTERGGEEYAGCMFINASSKNLAYQPFRITLAAEFSNPNSVEAYAPFIIFFDVSFVVTSAL